MPPPSRLNTPLEMPREYIDFRFGRSVRLNQTVCARQLIVLRRFGYLFIIIDAARACIT